MPTHQYGATATSAEIVADVDLRGRRAIVTGASSGIGVETARALASTGAGIALAVRIVKAGKKVANPQRLGKPEEFAALSAHIVENGFYNAATPRLDAGYRVPM